MYIHKNHINLIKTHKNRAAVVHVEIIVAHTYH